MCDGAGGRVEAKYGTGQGEHISKELLMEAMFD